MTPMRRHRRSRGVGLVTAIFLLVVIGALSVAMVTIFTSQQTSSTLDIQGARAYQAARAGIEWGLFRLRHGDNCAAETSFALPDDSSLRDFVVTVRCDKIEGPTTDDGDDAMLDRRRITATSCNLQPSNGSCPNPVNNPDYVQRVMEVQF